MTAGEFKEKVLKEWGMKIATSVIAILLAGAITSTYIAAQQFSRMTEAVENLREWRDEHTRRVEDRFGRLERRVRYLERHRGTSIYDSVPPVLTKNIDDEENY